MATVRPIIEIPKERDMRTEPARTIGNDYAGKDNVRLVIVGAVGLLLAFGVNVAPDVPQYAEMIVNGSMPIVLAAYAKWQLSRNAKAQAEDTRSIAFSPQTAEQLGTSSTPAKVIVKPASEIMARNRDAAA